MGRVAVNHWSANQRLESVVGPGTDSIFVFVSRSRVCFANAWARVFQNPRHDGRPPPNPLSGGTAFDGLRSVLSASLPLSFALGRVVVTLALRGARPVSPAPGCSSSSSATAPSRSSCHRHMCLTYTGRDETSPSPPARCSQPAPDKARSLGRAGARRALRRALAPAAPT
jgi:hypothetical protein